MRFSENQVTNYLLEDYGSDPFRVQVLLLEMVMPLEGRRHSIFLRWLVKAQQNLVLQYWSSIKSFLAIS